MSRESCKKCGVKITNGNNKYCSQECYHKDTTLEKTCPECGEEFETPQSLDHTRCSKECANKAISRKNSGENHYNWGGGEVEIVCENCGDKFEVPKCRVENGRKYCSVECMSEGYKGSIGGENHPRWVDYPEVECEYCGKKVNVRPARAENFRFCSRECMGDWISENMKGENHPRWEGGSVCYYGDNWLDMRRKALERDNFECRICGRGKGELGREPDVHHIKPIRSFDIPENANKLDNLVTLCASHHSKLERFAGLLPSNLSGS